MKPPKFAGASTYAGAALAGPGPMSCGRCRRCKAPAHAQTPTPTLPEEN